MSQQAAGGRVVRMGNKRVKESPPVISCGCCGYTAPEIDFCVAWEFGHMKCPYCFSEWWTAVYDWEYFQ